jgi:hypothetical protein
MFFNCLLAAISISSSQMIADCQFCSEDPVPVCDAYLKPCTYAPYRCNNLWTGFDLLIWRAYVDGFADDFGSVSIQQSVTSTTTTTIFHQRDKDIRFDWDAGFRATIGYDFAPFGSCLGFYWNRFHQKTNTKDGLNCAHWQLHYDTIDAQYNHHFWVDCCLDIQPIAALRFARITQGLKTDLQTVYTTPNEIIQITTATRDQQKLWALGPLFGLEANWFFICGLSLYGILDTGILYGHFNTIHRFVDFSPTGSTYRYCEGNGSASQFVLDLGLGISYQTQYLTLKTGVEHHRYADFNKIGCSGSLNLFGANLGLEIHY